MLSKLLIVRGPMAVCVAIHGIGILNSVSIQPINESRA